MCTPVAAGVIGAQIGGSLLQQNANNSAARRQASAQQALADRGTAISAKEFNERQRLQGENFNEVMGLSDREFGRRQEVSTETDRDVSAETDRALAEVRRIMGSSDQQQAGARGEFDAITGGAREAQNNYRYQADSEVDAGIRDFGFDARESRRVASAAGRNELAQGAITSPSAAPLTLSQAVQKELARQAQAKIGGVREEAERGAGVASYGDLLTAGDRRMQKTSERLGSIDRASDRDLIAAAFAAAPSQLRYTSAPELSRAEIAGMLASSDADIRARQGYGDALIGSSGEYESTVGGARSNYGAGLTGTSGAYEQAMRGILGNAAANTVVRPSQYGALIAQTGAALTPLMFNPATAGPSWRDLAARTPFAASNPRVNTYSGLFGGGV